MQQPRLSNFDRPASSIRLWLVFFITIACALMLEVLMVSGYVAYFWPQWVLLVMCYWILRDPQMVSFGLVFLLGLLQSVMHADPLGLDSALLVCLVYVVTKLRHRLCRLPLIQQTFFIMLLTLFYQLLKLAAYYWLEPGSLSALLNPWQQLTILTSLLAWPILQFIFKLLLSKHSRRLHAG